MINAILKHRDTQRVRESLHKLRDVQRSLNNGDKKNVKLYPGRKPSKIKKAGAGNKSETAKKDTERKTFAELEAEEHLRGAIEEVKKAIMRSKPDASLQSINKATMEVAKAIIRCR